MPTLHLLGTGAALSDAHRTTTMIAVSDDAHDGPSTLAVDCGGDLGQRLLAAGRAFDDVAGLIVTHAHPDHTAGFPLFVEKVWLSGRERPLPVVGIEPALAQIRRTWDAFAPITADWDVPPLDFRTVAHAPDAEVWTAAPWAVTASPVEHGDMPNVGLRIEHRPTGRVVAYSCDTSKCEAVTDLARGADVLVHEANGSSENHSSAEEAAEVARDADVGRLLLVHVPPGVTPDALDAARDIFAATQIGDEGGAYDF